MINIYVNIALTSITLISLLYLILRNKKDDNNATLKEVKDMVKEILQQLQTGEVRMTKIEGYIETLKIQIAQICKDRDEDRLKVSDLRNAIITIGQQANE